MALDVEAAYGQSDEFTKYAARVHFCSGVLRFGWVNDENGVSELRLREAKFCRVRYCPVCQWRRSLMLKARFINALPNVVAKYPDSRWVFLTLTVKNCPIHDLRETLQAMNEGWQRFIKRKEFRLVQGWIRSTEVTRGVDNTAHPHFHCLLMVPPSMLSGRGYVTQAQWTELWRECARLDYKPVIDIRVVRNRKGKKVVEASCSLDPNALLSEDMLAGIVEVAKYSVKEEDMTQDPEWFLELTRQTFRLRFIAAGGALKDAIRNIEDASDSDMIYTGEEEGGEEESESLVAFSFRRKERIYRRYPKGDK